MRRFIVLDSVAVVAAYGVAEVTYFRGRPPSLYWRHFALFLVLALVVHLTSSGAFGLYGRIWRYAGLKEARQVVLSALAAFIVLALARPLWHIVGLERVPLQVVVLGCAFVTMAIGALRVPSRLFAWQRRRHREA
jgi:FlaA1/EpsC-like NDP-sugar epimerase